MTHNLATKMSYSMESLMRLFQGVVTHNFATRIIANLFVSAVKSLNSGHTLGMGLSATIQRLVSHLGGLALLLY